jgi:hypothetical protein
MGKRKRKKVIYNPLLAGGSPMMGGMSVVGNVNRSTSGGTIGGGGLGYTAANMNMGDHHPLISDQNEFPALTNRNLPQQGDSYHQSLPTKPYG